MSGDSKGNIWYSSHRTPFMGKLDPKTGIVTEYQVPATPPGVLPGTHRIQVDKNDIVWASENWAHNLVRLDPATGDVHHHPADRRRRAAQHARARQLLDRPRHRGLVRAQQGGAEIRFEDRQAPGARPLHLTNNANPYDNIISDDGNFWAGGAPAGGGDTIEMMDTRTNKLLEVHSFSRDSTAAQGGFDEDGNPWFGGRGGALARARRQGGARSANSGRRRPYVTFYEAMPDKRGEVWAGELHGGRMLRFNPQTDHWTEYVLPEPYSHDRRTWIDNSTTPVTVWYVDHNSYLVRVQARE